MLQPLGDHEQEMPGPQGHAIGFVDTAAQCDKFTQALNMAGFSARTIKVLHGDDGVSLLNRMMGGSLWGETAEDVLKQGLVELGNGHYVVVVDCEDHDEAMVIARVATLHGGRAFNYFGLLIDEQITH
jgi:hypothetical protein